MKKLLLFLLLSGCAANMTAEQIEAAGKAKDASIVCVQGTGPWGKGQTTYINIDKSTIQNGAVTVDDQCKVTFTNEQARKP